jgi:hypothetical protein
MMSYMPLLKMALETFGLEPVGGGLVKFDGNIMPDGQESFTAFTTDRVWLETWCIAFLKIAKEIYG